MSKIKELLKNKKVAAGAALALIVVVAVSAVLLYRPSEPLPVADASVPESSNVAPTVPSIVISTQPSTSTTEPTSTTIPGVIDVGGDPDQTDTTESRVPAQEPEKPVTPVTPPTESGGIDIGGEAQQPEKYDCKTPNHHCINAENHAYIENLEIQGCSYCGSHSCPSFYAVSIAGLPICAPALCPEYNEKNDPLKYCKDCGRPIGNGDNGTCQQFLHDTTCDICGQHVKGLECHIHD